MEIQLPNPTEVTVVSERKVTVEKFTVYELVDVPSKKIVIAKTVEVGQIVLWRDADYDAIGQWTDTDVANKLLQMYGN